MKHQSAGCSWFTVQEMALETSKHVKIQNAPGVHRPFKLFLLQILAPCGISDREAMRHVLEKAIQQLDTAQVVSHGQ